MVVFNVVFYSFEINLHCRYSPTILLLRHFEVFKNLVSHEGSPHDQVGMNLEVASVIKEFTEPVAEDEEIYSEGKSNAYDVRCIPSSFTFHISVSVILYWMMLMNFLLNYHDHHQLDWFVFLSCSLFKIIMFLDSCLYVCEFMGRGRFRKLNSLLVLGSIIVRIVCRSCKRHDINGSM